MLCKKCYQKIPHGEEIQIDNSIICKECSQKPVAKCYTCSQLIYSNEPTHETTKTWVRGFNVWLFLINKGGLEKITQCDECYQEWRSEVKKKGKLLTASSTLLIICLIGLIFWTVYLFFPNIMEKIQKFPGIAILPSLIALGIIMLFFGKFLEIDRYKIKKRENESAKKVQKKVKK